MKILTFLTTFFSSKSFREKNEVPPPLSAQKMDTVDTETVRVTASNLIAQASNYTTGVMDPVVREALTNAQGYCIPGEDPYCGMTLHNEKDPDTAFLSVSSTSMFTIAEAKKMLDIGHSTHKDYKFGQKFNLGTYVQAAKVVKMSRFGLTAFCWNPQQNTGIAVRALVDHEQYMRKAGPFEFVLTADGKSVTFFGSAWAKANMHKISKLWDNSQWGVDLNALQSDANFGALIHSTCVATCGDAPQTTFIYAGLQTVQDPQYADGKAPREECILESFAIKTNKGVVHDIRVRYDEDEPSMRLVVRNAFCPAIDKFAGMNGDYGLKKRMFVVQGSKVPLEAVDPDKQIDAVPSGSEDIGADIKPPWVCGAAFCINKKAQTFQIVNILAGADDSNVPIPMRLARASTTENTSALRKNWEKTSRSRATLDDAHSAGTIVLFGDKVLNKLPFDAITGDTVYQSQPKKAALMVQLINDIFASNRFRSHHVDSLFEVMDMPWAKEELNEQQVRNQIGRSYREVSDILIKPVRTKLKVCDRAKLQLDEKQKEEKTDYVETRDRAILVEMFGLTTASVVQFGGLEQPVNKESISHLPQMKQDLNKIHAGILRCTLKFNLDPKTASKKMVEFIESAAAGWSNLRADEEQEKKDVIYIKQQLAKRESEKAQKAQEKKDQEQEAKVRKAQQEQQKAQQEQQKADERAGREEEKRKQAEQQATANKAKLDEEREARAVERQKTKEVEQKVQKFEEERKKNKEKSQRDSQNRKSQQTKATHGLPVKVAEAHRKIGLPDELRHKAHEDYTEGFEYNANVRGTQKFMELMPKFEAVSTLFRVESIGTGARPMFEPWVSDDMKTEALRLLWEDDALPRALQVMSNKKYQQLFTTAKTGGSPGKRSKEASSSTDIDDDSDCVEEEETTLDAVAPKSTPPSKQAKVSPVQEM